MHFYEQNKNVYVNVDKILLFINAQIIHNVICINQDSEKDSAVYSLIDVFVFNFCLYNA